MVRWVTYAEAYLPWQVGSAEPFLCGISHGSLGLLSTWLSCSVSLGWYLRGCCLPQPNARCHLYGTARLLDGRAPCPGQRYPLGGLYVALADSRCGTALAGIRPLSKVFKSHCLGPTCGEMALALSWMAGRRRSVPVDGGWGVAMPAMRLVESHAS